MNKILVLTLIGLISGEVSASPMDERNAVCYQFSGIKLLNKTTCIVSSGYGAGGSYDSIQIGKKEYTAETSTCYDPKKDKTTECGITLNDKKAFFYNRDLFYKKIIDKTLVDDKSLSCYKTVDGKKDLCFK